MFDLTSLIISAGYLGVTSIIFAESGLFFGFFLPGDSLIFTAGFLASQGYFDITTLSVLLFLAAVLGDNVGYAFGKKVGPAIFKKEESLWFKPSHLDEAHSFFIKHGGKSIILARFIPVVRTFTPILAGVGKMNYRKFFAYNLLGGFLWASGLTFLGYYLGRSIPNADHYILPIVLLIIFVSLLPVLKRITRHREKRAAIRKFLSRSLKFFFPSKPTQ